MAATNVDIVFVIDASASMAPCFEQLKKHLADLLHPLQQTTHHIRLGLVAHSAGVTDDACLYAHRFLGGDMALLYRKDLPPEQKVGFFTDDPTVFLEYLAELSCEGDEDSLIALDVALDFPFGPLHNTKRVIALFSDEMFESGLTGDGSAKKLPALIDKLHARHIQLFCAIPEGKAGNRLAMADRSEIEFIEGEGGLADVDFSQLLGQMGKSISVSSLQATSEPPWQPAIFGQDKWDLSDDEIPKEDS